MFKNLNALKLMAILMLGMPVLTGCVAALAVGAAAGAGGIIWAKGALQQQFAKSMDDVYAAAKKALQELELPVKVDRKDQMAAKIESEFADGKRVWIKIDYLAKATTRISIRVGTLGDEIRSHEILEKIIRNL